MGTPVDRPPVARLPSGSSKVVSDRSVPPPFVLGSYALRCLIDLIVFAVHISFASGVIVLRSSVFK